MSFRAMKIVITFNPKVKFKRFQRSLNKNESKLEETDEDDSDESDWEDILNDSTPMDVDDFHTPVNTSSLKKRRKPRRRSYNKSSKKSNVSNIETKLTFYDILEAAINNNNYDEQFQTLLQTNPTPTILDLHTHFLYLSHHWDGVHQQAFEEDHPSLCDYYGNLLQLRHDIFISNPDYKFKKLHSSN